MQAATPLREEIETIFERVDRNRDGVIEIEEFSVLMLEIDHRCPATDLRACFDEVDVDRDGRVNFEELRAWLSRRSSGSDLAEFLVENLDDSRHRPG